MTRINWITGAAALITTVLGLIVIWANPSNPALVAMSLALIVWIAWHIEDIDDLMRGDDAE